MEKKFYEVYEGASAQIVVKKSKFIGDSFSVRSEEDVIEAVNSVKKKHYDARHHCYAYCLSDDTKVRASDDGEPSGTAGRPILDVILGEGMRNTLVVVTRYFGGTLLGTGGLTRAYRDAAKEVLEQTVKLEKLSGVMTTALIGYDLIGKAENLLKEKGVVSLETEYGEGVTLKYMTDEANAGSILKRLTEISSGEAKIEISETMDYGLAGDRVIWL